MRLEGIAGRVAVVTGSSSGIGLRVAETLRALGASVAGLDLGDAATGLDLALSADVRDEAQIDRAFARAESELGPVEMLVTCAGVFTPMETPELGLDEWRRTIDVNVNGTFICSQAVIPAMVDAGHGKIVNLASMASALALRERAAYNTSKAAIIGLTRSIAVEVGDAGVHCNAIAPGVIETPLSAPYFEDESMVSVLRRNSPMGRWGQVDEISGPALFLCSEESSFVNGATLFVDGGWTAGKGY